MTSSYVSLAAIWNFFPAHIFEMLSVHNRNILNKLSQAVHYVTVNELIVIDMFMLARN